MSSKEQKAAIAEARKQAEQLAFRVIRRGTRGGAGEAERASAETATLILDIAERSASLLFADDAQNRLREFQEWGERQINKISDVDDENRKRESAERVLAAIDVRREELLAWIDEQALRAWENACRDLQELSERS
jgi:hypothetical protein